MVMIYILKGYEFVMHNRNSRNQIRISSNQKIQKNSCISKQIAISTTVSFSSQIKFQVDLLTTQKNIGYIVFKKIKRGKNVRMNLPDVF